MKHSIAWVALALTLSACTSSPKLTQQERQAQRVSTLNVYADNRVGMKTARDWLWTASPDRILAIEVDNRVYNVKDVESVTREQKELIVVRLNNAEPLKAPPNRVRWLACDTSKACTHSADAMTRDWRDDLGHLLKKIEVAKLKNPDTIKLGRSDITDNPRTAIIDDYRARPDFDQVGDRVIVLQDAEVASLNERLATVLKDWDDKAPERKAREARALEEIREAARQRFEQLRSARIGTPAYCERTVQGDLPKDMTLNCPNHGGAHFSINDFEKAGWNIVAINTTPTVDALGHPFTVHRVSFQKVR